MSTAITQLSIEQTVDLLSFQDIESTDSVGKFSIQPLKRGFGTTLANTLRRTLLSSIRGWSVVSIRFEYTDSENKDHILSSEFESIPGVREDTIDIISNLKHLSWSVESEESIVEKQYEFSGSKDVVSQDFSAELVTVAETDVPVFSIIDSSGLRITLILERGTGYVPSEEIDTHGEYGLISVDALFSPVTNVRFEVLQTQVENKTDYEKVILEVITNGTINPREAVVEAASVLQRYFRSIVGGSEHEVQETSSSLEDLSKKKILTNSVESLELSVRALNCLRSIEIKTIGDLIEKTEAELSTTRNFGKKSLDEILASLESLNLSLKKD